MRLPLNGVFIEFNEKSKAKKHLISRGFFFLSQKMLQNIAMRVFQMKFGLKYEEVFDIILLYVIIKSQKGARK